MRGEATGRDVMFRPVISTVLDVGAASARWGGVAVRGAGAARREKKERIRPMLPRCFTLLGYSLIRNLDLTGTRTPSIGR